MNAMLPFLTSYYGNPHSRTHAYGWESEKAMEVARQQVREHVQCVTWPLIFRRVKVDR